jgi:glycosyltransferase involved in cell wall biosynthesis
MRRQRVVLQLIECSGIGGAETVLLELCKGLDQKFWHPICGLLKDGWLNEQLNKQGIETTLITNKYSLDLSCLWQLIQIIRRNNVDIVHSHEFTMNIYGAVAALLTGRPHIATIHGKGYYWEKQRRKLAYHLMALSPATTIVTVSANLRDFIADKIGIRKNGIRVIYNGVDAVRFNEKNESSGTRTAEQMNLGNPVIGTIGNLYPVKGHLYLIRAASRIVQEYPGASFLIIGKKTDHLARLQKEVSDLGLQKNILFLGFRQDIPQLLQLMDVFVLPSIEETFSIATLEAMALALPVVVTKCGGPQEFVEDGQSGLLVPPKDPTSLAATVLTLLKDKEFSNRISQAGRKRALEDFSLSETNLRYQELYENVCPKWLN